MHLFRWSWFSIWACFTSELYSLTMSWENGVLIPSLPSDTIFPIAKLEHLIKSPPVEFPENLTNLQDQEYLTGYFDSKSEPIFIFLRPLLKESSTSSKQPESGGGFFSSSNSNIGAQLVLPFVMTESRLVEAYNQLLLDSGREDLLISDNSNGNKQQPMRILVNVGWVPNSSSSPQSAYNQEIELIGVIRKTEKREPKKDTAKKDTGHGYVSRLDMSKISYQSYPISLAYHGKTLSPVGAQTRVALCNGAPLLHCHLVFEKLVYEIGVKNLERGAFLEQKRGGAARRRSGYLTHAKRTLYQDELRPPSHRVILPDF
ncbi:Surfeit locus protein 1 [Tyrophagus putrescentiae]|nr:Surfeit locus protein 1 [Tyrophagus putrescentiae]